MAVRVPDRAIRIFPALFSLMRMAINHKGIFSKVSQLTYSRAYVHIINEQTKENPLGNAK